MNSATFSAHERLLIERACERVVLDSVHYNDSGDFAAMAALFTVDAVLHRPSGAPLTGRDAIVASYRQRPADRITRHICSNMRVTLLEDGKAHVLTYALLYAADASATPDRHFGVPAEPRHLVGEFADTLVCTDEGWRICERVGRFVMHS